jgi:hypothetical protein
VIDILFKGIDTRQSVTHANGTIGGYWTFEIEPGEFKLKDATSSISIRVIHRWFASYSDGWKVTIPAGCPSDNGIEIMKRVQERLSEVYGEG